MSWKVAKLVLAVAIGLFVFYDGHVVTGSETKCGVPYREPKSVGIIGGSTAQKWPWYAALYYKEPTRPGRHKKHFTCGGTLISNRHIVTAATCLWDADSSEFVDYKKIHVRLGLTNPEGNQDEERVQERKLVKYVYQIDFDINLYAKDIAVLELNEPVEYSRYVRPACIQRTGGFANETGTVVGFGEKADGKISSKLKEADMFVTTSKQCKRSSDVLRENLKPGMFCATLDGGPSMCRKDGGNGLFLQRGNAWYLAGVLSFRVEESDEDCSIYADNVFTHVPSFLTLIDEAVAS